MRSPPTLASMGEQRVTGHRVPLPDGARGPFAVYVNGDEQREGDDYRIEDGRIVFARDLRWAKRTGILGWAVMATAGVGFYEDMDVVDVHYRDARGGAQVASGLGVDSA